MRVASRILVAGLAVVALCAVQVLCQADGTACVQPTDCTSGSCLNFCCRNPTPTECTACASGTGACTTCNANFELSNGDCLLVGGQVCLQGTECSSSRCLNGKCCTATAPTQCTACSGAGGACSSCSAGYTFSAGNCLGQDGQSCTVNSGCVNNRCLNGKCCATTAPAQCSSCAVTTGTCDGCNAGYTLTAGACLGQDGQTCTVNSGCVNNRCLNGKCCATTAPTQCSSCAVTTGTCDGCNAGYTLTAGACLKSNGQTCTVDGDCANSLCLNGKCCAAGAPAQCSSCAVTTGACDGCSAGYTLTAGDCVAAAAGTTLSGSGSMPPSGSGAGSTTTTVDAANITAAPTSAAGVASAAVGVCVALLMLVAL